MAETRRLNAIEALASAPKGQAPHNVGMPIGEAVAFVCPFPQCGVYALHAWGAVKALSTFPNIVGGSSRPYTGSPLITSKCQACGKEVIFVSGKMVWPQTSEAPAPAVDLPAALVADYAEAAAICAASPRGAAALLRLAIQKLCADLGSTEKTIDKAIGAFVAEGRISGAIQQAMDAVRVIGNEAVHPGTMDLQDDAATVTSLFRLINFIVEKMITEPKHVAEIYGSLPPDKLAGIAQRDAAPLKQR